MGMLGFGYRFSGLVITGYCWIFWILEVVVLRCSTISVGYRRIRKKMNFPSSTLHQLPTTCSYLFIYQVLKYVRNIPRAGDSLHKSRRCQSNCLLYVSHNPHPPSTQISKTNKTRPLFQIPSRSMHPHQIRRIHHRR